MKQKKTYIQPDMRTSKMNISNIICMSIHDEDATIVGAKGSSIFEDEEPEEVTFGE